MTTSVSRREILGFRVRAQHLDRDDAKATDTSILDFGVQDTGTDGSTWALAIRGVDADSIAGGLATLWTLRGAPHVYRRRDLPSVAAASAPFSEADAGKRIFDAAKPLKAAGIGNIEALDTVATHMRSVVTKPMVKGEVSARLTELLDGPYLRFCRSCNATHCYEMTLRLGAARAGLELEPGTSPPVLRPVTGFTTSEQPAEQHDVVRAYLRLFGPATPKQVAEFIDAPVKDVKARWPSNAVEVEVDGQKRWLLSSDLDGLADPPSVTRFLGPYDLFLQAKDRQLLVADPAKIKALWPALGRPGAILSDGEIVGTWRPRKSGAKLTVSVDLWEKSTPPLQTAIQHEAQRLADFRNVTLAAVDVATP